MSAKAIFLDRDGTLIINRHYLADPAGVELLPGVADTLRRLLSDGYMLFLFTNQSGVGRGMFTLETVHRCNQRMIELLDLPAPAFTEICIAPESPDMPAVYRKPAPRFILETIAKYSLAPDKVWMVGDSANDALAGLNAGVRAVLVHGGEVAELPATVWRCRDLVEFYSKLLNDQASLPCKTTSQP
jgi:D-glycero-D-manno-heptose 1,7-bisphosphate phosphatase